jgi:RNA polymerase subunit RPABC4/transcription elongation factor Spt4
MVEGQKDIFLSCFKCGRIVRACDSECPRCGLQFGPGTLFECPFCSGLVWRNASKCSTCGIDLTEFSLGVEKTFAGFDMDEFVENIIDTELEQLRSSTRRVACPGCGLMIRGDEEKCPRCDLPLAEVNVICPVCGEKMQFDAKSCPNCRAEFEDRMEIPGDVAMVEEVLDEPEPTPEMSVEGLSAEIPSGAKKPSAAPKAKKKPAKAKPAKKPAKTPAKKPVKKPASTKGKPKPAKTAASKNAKNTKSAKGSKARSQKKHPSKSSKKR